MEKKVNGEVPTVCFFQDIERDAAHERSSCFLRDESRGLC